jgi:predicted amidophosphoribosyltransferase
MPDPDLYLRLESAQLCVDCEAVYQIARDLCPSCGSGSALPLGKVLSADENRELVDNLRALSRMLTWAKRPPRSRIAHQLPAERALEGGPR